MIVVTPVNVVAALLTLAPLVWAAFWPERWARLLSGRAVWVRMVAPALLAVPYAMVAGGAFAWGWLLFYAAAPVAVAMLLAWAARLDPEQRGVWQDYLVLAAVGLAVDLRWLERAWPAHLAIFSKMLLVDAGLYGFLCVRRLSGVGFDLSLRGGLRLRDVLVGVRELGMYTPVALLLGLGLGFLHTHAGVAWWRQVPGAFVFTFFFIAVPEELFFRGWMQNLLERRLGRWPALAVTAVIFGLAHFNKRAVHFNWRYVLMAAIAGVFYGRAWRQDRRVGASAITHAAVDTIWSVWLR